MIKAILGSASSSIKDSIIYEIENSKFSIQIAVAWFTNGLFLKALNKVSEQGVKVEVIINDNDINGKFLNFEKYQKQNFKVSVIESLSYRFLHEKFALFDSKTLIMGSYNWTKAAEFSNFESVIISDENVIVNQYVERFKELSLIANIFSRKLLNKQVGDEIILDEKESQALENDLELELIRALDIAKKLKAHINHASIIDKIKRYGAVNESKRLMENPTIFQSGFTKLLEKNRLDLSFENIILNPKYKDLFNQQTTDNARKKLASCNFTPSY